MTKQLRRTTWFASACLVVSLLVVPTATAALMCGGKRVTIKGTSGPDRLVGTRGNDVIAGLGGGDELIGKGGKDTICGGKRGDNVRGGRGADRLIGQGGADFLAGGGGNDILETNGGFSQVMVGQGGDDQFVGGGPFDFVDFVFATNGVTVDLVAGTAVGEGNDTLTGVVGVFGSEQGDILRGNGQPNLLYGFAGDDQINGNGGGDLGFPDFYRGGSGNDTFTGSSAGVDEVVFTDAQQAMTVDLQTGTATGEGTDVLNEIDSVTGSTFGDTLNGSSEDNGFAGGPGNDVIDGRAGDDTVIHFGSGPVIVDLAAGTVTGEGNDTLAGIENVWGTSGNDSLSGDDLANYLDGGEGDDQLFGLGGSDLLDGWNGTDTLDGGDGLDRCLNGESVSNCEQTTSRQKRETRAARYARS